MVHDKGGLDQMLFHKLLKEKVQDIALLMAPLKLHMLFPGGGPGFFQGMDLAKVHA